MRVNDDLVLKTEPQIFISWKEEKEEGYERGQIKINSFQWNSNCLLWCWKFCLKKSRWTQKYIQDFDLEVLKWKVWNFYTFHNEWVLLPTIKIMKRILFLNRNAWIRKCRTNSDFQHSPEQSQLIPKSAERQLHCWRFLIGKNSLLFMETVKNIAHYIEKSRFVSFEVGLTMQFSVWKWNFQHLTSAEMVNMNEAYSFPEPFNEHFPNHGTKIDEIVSSSFMKTRGKNTHTFFWQRRK